MSHTALEKNIRLQREMLTRLLSEAMHDLAKRCAEIIDVRISLETLLTNALPKFSYCKHLYVLNASGVQITENITQHSVSSRKIQRPVDIGQKLGI